MARFSGEDRDDGYGHGTHQVCESSAQLRSQCKVLSL